VHERRQVDQFDDAGATHQGGGRRTAGAGREGEQGAEALARMGEHVADHRPDLRFERQFLRREELLEGREMGF
jgi:hypothetical protein